MLTPAARLAAMLQAFFEALVRFFRRLLGIAGEAGSMLAEDAKTAWCGVTAVNEGVGRGLDFAVAKPGMALARGLGGAALSTAGAVGSLLGALAPSRPTTPADLARQAVAADDAPMPSLRPAVSTRPRLGDGRTQPYLLQGNALGSAVQDIARARAMGDASVGRIHADVPKEVLQWIFDLSHTQLAAVSRLPAAHVHAHITGQTPAPGLPPAPPAQSIAALPLYSPDELTAMSRQAMAYMRRETAEVGRIAEAAGRRRLVGEPGGPGPALAL
ncbi:hypothetical protein [Methylobacterium indicum]|uniref:Uncharacterized protein n=1 Tax=Methylobacterium indicum TaxID=1775910 RepID=A0A8H9C4Q3_9HYPH|nr:hypothetical protein [Methylobacterium indicum]BCM83807.1 hypothetical protein mvi_22680 [Methylobacterium indicum]